MIVSNFYFKQNVFTMGKCFNCNNEVNLQDDQINCPFCNNILRYNCIKCHQEFLIINEKNKKLKECRFCGYFICPHCSSCNLTCSRMNFGIELQNILQDILIKPFSEEHYLKILNSIDKYFLYSTKDKTFCLFNVPKSYAKERIKNILLRQNGLKNKNNNETIIFLNRFNDIKNKPIGTILTISSLREQGHYGQEYRDVCNYCICEGILKVNEISKDDDKNEIKYVYERINGQNCINFNKNIFLKKCPNKSCKYTTKNIDEISCKKCNKLLVIFDSKNSICILPNNQFKKRNLKKEDDRKQDT